VPTWRHQSASVWQSGQSGESGVRPPRHAGGGSGSRRQHVANIRVNGVSWHQQCPYQASVIGRLADEGSEAWRAAGKMGRAKAKKVVMVAWADNRRRQPHRIAGGGRRHQLAKQRKWRMRRSGSSAAAAAACGSAAVWHHGGKAISWLMKSGKHLAR